FWRLNQNWQEGRSWAEAVLASPGAATETNARKRALACAGSLAFVLDDFESANARIQESIALGESLGDMSSMAVPIQLLGMVNIGRGNYGEARHFCEMSVDIARRGGSKGELALAL